MKIKPAQRVQQIREYYFSKKLREIAQLRKEGKDILNLGIGSPDLAPAETVVGRLRQESQIPHQHGYQSYIGIPALREAFATWYERHFKVLLDPSGEILPLMGSKEGVMHLSMTFLEKGDEVLIPNPGYPAYSATALLAGATPVSYELSAENNWLPDLQQLAGRDLSKVKIMWINYPHMPTGAKATLAFFEELVAFAQKHEILIANDNPYSFILNDQPLSLLSVTGAKEVAVELNSLSKSHNMAGWRVGMMAGSAELLQEVLKFKSNMDSGMFLPVQQAAVEALSLPDTWYESINKVYHQRQQKAFAIMDQLGCSYDTEAGGLFVWGKVPADWKDAFVLSDHLLYEAGVFITPGGIFGSQGKEYLRISLCSNLQHFATAQDRITTLYTTVSQITNK